MKKYVRNEHFISSDVEFIKKQQNRIDQIVDGQVAANNRSLLSNLPDVTITENDPKFNPLLATQTDDYRPYEYEDLTGTEYDRAANPISQVFNMEYSILPQIGEVDNVIMDQNMGGEMKTDLVSQITDYGKMINTEVDNKAFVDDDGQNIPADRKQDMNEFDQYKQQNTKKKI